MQKLSWWSIFGWEYHVRMSMVLFMCMCAHWWNQQTLLFVVLFMGISQNATWVCVCACTMCCWVYYHSPHAELSDQGWVALYAACWDSASVRMKHLHSFYLFSALTLSKFWWLELFYLCRFFFLWVWVCGMRMCAYVHEFSWVSCQCASGIASMPVAGGNFFFYLLPAHSNI